MTSRKAGGREYYSDVSLKYTFTSIGTTNVSLKGKGLLVIETGTTQILLYDQEDGAGGTGNIIMEVPSNSGEGTDASIILPIDPKIVKSIVHVATVSNPVKVYELH